MILQYIFSLVAITDLFSMPSLTFKNSFNNNDPIVSENQKAFWCGINLVSLLLPGCRESLFLGSYFWLWLNFKLFWDYLDTFWLVMCYMYLLYMLQCYLVRDVLIPFLCVIWRFDVAVSQSDTCICPDIRIENIYLMLFCLLTLTLH